ncbi:MAG: alpha/beta hydrolase [Oscillospiraceae bacterium]|nr:alpha/beta hydrolase [Oscillospiraceae bacterium]
MVYILIHGSGQKATSWNETISHMKSDKEILCLNLSSMLNGKEASYANLYASFIEYCNELNGQINLCGLSFGGILALNYTLDFPDKVNTLVLISTPYRIPRIMFGIQNIVFRFLPKSIFENMEFSKKDMAVLGNSIKKLNFSNRVQNIKCSTLIVCGKKDGANIKFALFLAENIENSKLEIIKNVGHVVNEENPKALAKILDEYYDHND